MPESDSEKRLRLERLIEEQLRRMHTISRVRHSKTPKPRSSHTRSSVGSFVAQSADSLFKEAQASGDLLDKYKMLVHTSEGRLKTAENAFLVKQQEADFLQKMIRAQEVMIRNSDTIVQADLDDMKIMQEKLAVLEEQIEFQDKFTVTLKDSIAASKELGTSFGNTLAVYEKSTLFNVENMVKFGKAIFGGTKSMKAFGKAVLTAGITSFVNSIIGLMIKMNESETAFQRATGASQSFSREMTNSYEAVRGNTVSVDQNQQAWTSLYNSYTDFTMISPAARQEIGQTVATLAQLGVSADTAAKAMQTATVALNQTGTQAAATLIELEGYARDIGVAPAQLIEQYGTMGGSLAKLGQNGTRAFKDLARVSKITGIEMQKLLNMTDKFDTFEGAAEQAGKLNAALGTNAVNAMDLLMETDPAARFEQIRDSILDSGLSFDTMSYYQRKFFAETLGLKDAGELAAVMRGDMEGLGGEIGKTAQDYEEMANRARDAASIKEKLTAVLMKMIPVFMPLIDSLDKMLTAWLDNKEGVKQFQNSIEENMPTIETIIGALKNLGKAIAWAVTNWKSMIAILVGIKVALVVLPALFTGLIGLIPGLGAAATTLGAAMTAGALGMLAFGAAAVGIGGGIWLASKGMTSLIAAIGEASGGELAAFAATLGVIALAIWGLNACSQLL